MKKCAPLFTAAMGILSLACFAQQSDRPPNGKIENTLGRSGSDLALFYPVEEPTDSRNSETTYEAARTGLAANLPQSHIGAVMVKFDKAKATVRPANTIVAAPIRIATTSSKRMKYAEIDILGTYERVLDKGYESVDMLSRVGNGRYFDGDLVTAAKWYSQLFKLTTDLEPVYFYRYAQALKAVNEFDKANEMMVVFADKELRSKKR